MSNHQPEHTAEAINMYQLSIDDYLEEVREIALVHTRHSSAPQKYAIVSACDYDWLMQWNWYYLPGGYAHTHYKVDCVRQNVYMHRLIASAPSDMQIDHINGNKLDNRRSNLRQATEVQNHRNQKKRMGTSSRYIGVIWDRENNKWRAAIHTNKKFIFLGRFTSEIEAAHAYDVAAREYFGEFANPNFPNGDSNV